MSALCFRPGLILRKKNEAWLLQGAHLVRS